MASGLTVHVLGSGSGLPTARRDTTSLLVRGPDGVTLVDCPGGIVHKLARLNVQIDDLRRVILTHDHVDHVYGFPHLIHALRVSGSTRRVAVHAPAPTCRTVERLLEVHGLCGTDYPTVELHAVDMATEALLAHESGVEIRSAATVHGRDTIALRFRAGPADFAHSSDTGPAEEVVGLAKGAGLLFHDCGGLDRFVRDSGSPHASARAAGEAAAAAGVGALCLIHLGVESEHDEAAVRREAMESFAGPVDLAFDGAVYRLPMHPLVAAVGVPTG